MDFLQFLVNGLTFGSIYALIAVSFVVIYRGTKVLNFAQGEFMLFGNYVAFMFILSTGLPFIVAFVIAVLVNALLALLLEAAIFRKFIGESVFSVVMVTIGLSSVLKGVIGLIWGHELQRIPLPFDNRVYEVMGIRASVLDITIVTLTVVILGILLLFYKYTKWGVSMRAAASDQDTAQLMGISINNVNRLTWAVSAMISVAAGFALVSNSYLQPTQSAFALKAFPAIVLGGMDSIPGAVIGGFALGILESIAGGYLSTVFGSAIKEITAYFLLLLVLIVLPYGIFGTKEIERV